MSNLSFIPLDMIIFGKTIPIADRFNIYGNFIDFLDFS